MRIPADEQGKILTTHKGRKLPAAAHNIKELGFTEPRTGRKRKSLPC